MKPILRTMTAAAAAVAAATAAARAEISVDITQGTVKPILIAIPEFAGPDGGHGRRIADVVSADLERSGLFRPVDRRAFPRKIPSLAVKPRFADWRAIAAQALVAGGVGMEPDGRLRAEFRLWDVFGGAQMAGYTYRTDPGNWRRVAHIIADAIYERVTGEAGYFDSRIVYVAESGPPEKRIKRLAIMDQDGANHRFLTSGGALALTPRFSPTEQLITYLSYVAGRPRAVLRDIDTGREEVIGDFPGMTFAPRFSPDGNKVVLSLADDGNSEIYAMDVRTRRIERLTRHPAIDTSPSYAPDGRRIVFNSNRGGTQQLYVMDADGASVRRISFGKGRYATPVWSPRGDLIAFTRILSDRFSIGVMRPDGSGERFLAEGYLVEGPTWAPNGRVLMFFRQERGGEPRLFSIDLTGHNEREVPTPAAGSDPAWSPRAR